MNNRRRNNIIKSCEELEKVIVLLEHENYKNIKGIIDTIKQEKIKLENIKNEEDECRDKMPENLQSSLKYETSENASECIEGAANKLCDAIGALKSNQIEDAIDNLDETIILLEEAVDN